MNTGLICILCAAGVSFLGSDGYNMDNLLWLSGNKVLGGSWICTFFMVILVIDAVDAMCARLSNVSNL